MGCVCHGPSRLKADNISAYEQCRFCGSKHLVTAHALLTEYGYADKNLSHIDGQLRLSILHLQYIEEDIAKMIREVAVKIEQRDLSEVTAEKLEEIIGMLQKRIYEEFPDLKQKHEDFLKK